MISEQYVNGLELRIKELEQERNALIHLKDGLIDACNTAKWALEAACPKSENHNCWITETLNKMETFLREST